MRHYILPIEWKARQTLESLCVFCARVPNDFGRKLRHGRLLVPLNGFEIIPDILLIEAVLGLARLELGLFPETGRIRSQDFINENDLPVQLPKFEFRIA